jgi:hypothetical protein
MAAALPSPTHNHITRLCTFWVQLMMMMMMILLAHMHNSQAKFLEYIFVTSEPPKVLGGYEFHGAPGPQSSLWAGLPDCSRISSPHRARVKNAVSNPKQEGTKPPQLRTILSTSHNCTNRAGWLYAFQKVVMCLIARYMQTVVASRLSSDVMTLCSINERKKSH